MDFERRKHYYGLGQILPYLQPGAQVLDTATDTQADVDVLAVRTPTGQPAVFLVNQEERDVLVDLNLLGEPADSPSSLVVTRTDSHADAEPQGRVRLRAGSGSLTLPARSITTLVPRAALAGVA
jgi:O-glycosyl hydrolase